MNIYKLKSDVEGFLWICTLNKKDSMFTLNYFKGHPISNAWYPMEVEHLIQSQKDKRSPAGDFPNWGGGAPVFSRNALDSVRDFLQANGEILPLKCKDGEYYAYNVTNIIDVLDEGRSEMVYYPTGGVSKIIQYVFHEDLVRNEVIFKIPQMKKMVYVTDAFVQRIHEGELQGFKFPEVYPYTEDPWAFLKKKK